MPNLEEKKQEVENLEFNSFVKKMMRLGLHVAKQPMILVVQNMLDVIQIMQQSSLPMHRRSVLRCPPSKKAQNQAWIWRNNWTI
jgi:hypothetical protein